MSILKIAGLLFFIFSFSCCQAQSELKTEHVFLITLDGLRWQELYNGADPNLINDQEYVKDTVALKSLFWDESESRRRKK
ncbi:MAG: phosphoglyceromutase, partial [Cyclobacteriaceae bacterium]